MTKNSSVMKITFKKQKSHAYQEKKEHFYNFITFLLTPNQSEQKSNWKYYPQFN